jgi:polysaccharide chain length determinant protein (PEP-CTERM system associated)
MQVQDSFSVARRALDVEDYIDITRRHKGWIFGPLFAALVVSVVGAFLWPDTFVSSATIKVIPQVVPEAYVQSNVNQVMSDRIGAIAQTVLSRPVLTSIITTYDLYQRDRQRLPMEDVIENMRKDIKIGNVLNVSNTTKDHIPAFQIQFAYIDKYKAQKVVNDLVSKFIDQNQRERSNSSLSTTSLLRDQWDLAKKELDQVESKLAEFRTRNQGRLPDEMQQNLQQVTAVQQRMSTLNSALARVSQEKLMMESQVRIYKDQLSALAKDASSAPDMSPVRSERLTEAEREVHAYESHLAMLRDHYKETYPDVQQAVALLTSAKKKRDQIAKEEEVKKPDTPQKNVKPEVIREGRDLEAAVRRVQSQIEAKDLEAEEYRKEMAMATNNMKSYQSRLDGIPASAKENDELTRNREMARAKFVDLDLKMNKALMAQDMENRKAGEYLEPLDPPSLPQTPTQPKRPMVIGIGAVIGLVLGILFAGGREMKDTSLKNLKDVRAYTKLPILGSVPLLENDLVVKRRRRFAWFAWSLACLTGIVVMSGSVIYYYATRV